MYGGSFAECFEEVKCEKTPEFRSLFESVKNQLKAAYETGHREAANERSHLGMWLWGVILSVVCGFIIFAVILTLSSCAPSTDTPLIMNSCGSETAGVVYLIMKDWGSGIGIVGAGAGLAWSTFFKA